MGSGPGSAPPALELGTSETLGCPRRAFWVPSPWATELWGLSQHILGRLGSLPNPKRCFSPKAESSWSSESPWL